MTDRSAEHITRKLAQPQSHKLAQADGRKTSPLIDRTQSPVRVPGAPAVRPIASTGARSVGDAQDVAPASSVSGMPSHYHLHSHADGLGGYYQHEHSHSHDVRHSPSDEMDANLHEHHSADNKAARLQQIANELMDHPDPLIRRGAHEMAAKAAEISPRAAARAIQKFAATKAATAARSAEVRSRVEPAPDRIAELVTTAEWHKKAAADPRNDFYLAQAHRDRYKAIADELRQLAGLDDDAVIEKFAKGARQPTAIVRKAAVTSSDYALTSDASRAIRAAVNKAFENLDQRIAGLQERSSGSLPRKRL
jgi:hypothetical protein